jgi:hypothetical protein
MPKLSLPSILTSLFSIWASLFSIAVGTVKTVAAHGLTPGLPERRTLRP